MLFSVIIPAYNCNNSIRSTVASIFQSGLFDFEIVIVDDGSTDGTSETCDILEAQFDNIHCIHQKKLGVSSARNCGIEEANGEYLLFFDSDDAVDVGSLKHAAEIAQQKSPDMLIFGLSFDYYFRGRMYRRDDFIYSQEGFLRKELSADEFVALYECNALSPVWNKFIRRSVLIEHQIQFRRDLIEMEDFLFVIHCFKYCCNIYVLSEAIYRYRQAENERSTFQRLLRIRSLSGYMQPFEEGMQELIDLRILKKEDSALLSSIVEEIYVFLFQEQIRFGNITEIERAAKDMLYEKYADTMKISDPKLFQLLKETKYRQVWCQSAKVRLRHWLAVRMKYIRSYWSAR